MNATGGSSDILSPSAQFVSLMLLIKFREFRLSYGTALSGQRNCCKAAYSRACLSIKVCLVCVFTPRAALTDLESQTYTGICSFGFAADQKERLILHSFHKETICDSAEKNPICNFAQ